MAAGSERKGEKATGHVFLPSHLLKFINTSHLILTGSGALLAVREGCYQTEAPEALVQRPHSPAYLYCWKNPAHRGSSGTILLNFLKNNCLNI
jgi:hypothetical protein